jgi:prepilin-type processing-associated H-X9-DG protein
MHNYHDNHKAFPPGSAGNQTMTWAARIFPYIELTSQYNQLDWAQYYNAAQNAAVLCERIPAYTCPSDSKNQTMNWGGYPTDTTRRFSLHNYMACSGNTANDTNYGWIPFWPANPTQPNRLKHNGAIFESRTSTGLEIGGRGKIFCCPIEEIADGTANTMALAECIQGQQSPLEDFRGFIFWTQTTLYSAYNPPNTTIADYMVGGYCNTDGNPKAPCMSNGARDDYYYNTYVNQLSSRSRHTGGVMVGMADGAVNLVSDTVNLDAWRAASTTNGKESLSL